MELRADSQRRAQHQQELLQNHRGNEAKKKQKLFVIYFLAGLSFIAVLLIGFVAYKIVYAPVEYQLAPSAPPVNPEPVKPESTQIMFEGKTYDSVQAFLDRDTEPALPVPRDDLPAGAVAE